MARTLYILMLVMATFQAGYALFWPAVILLEFQPFWDIQVSAWLSGAIQVAPRIMLLNAFVYGALYLYAFAGLLRRDLSVFYVYSVGLLLNLGNWFFSVGIGGYNGEIGGAFILNGILLWAAFVFARLRP